MGSLISKPPNLSDFSEPLTVCPHAKSSRNLVDTFGKLGKLFRSYFLSLGCNNPNSDLAATENHLSY